MRDPRRELEHLGNLAAADPVKRFGKLYRLVCHRELLRHAGERVRQNTGGRTAGIDGQTRRHIDDGMLDRLAEELAHNRYHPQAVRRAYIPKGKTGRRALGIPAIRDRIVQAVVYWLTAHYLGRKHRCSIKRVMRTRYGVDPTSGKRALYTTGNAGKRVYLWNKPPPRRSLLSGVVGAKDVQPLPITSWAGGHSYEQRMQVRSRSAPSCEHCGTRSPNLIVHHPHRLAMARQRKLGPANVIASAQKQHVKLLCFACHQQHHPGGWNR